MKIDSLGNNSIGLKRVLRRVSFIAVMMLLMPLSGLAQKIAVKTNLLEWATISPNLSAEFVVSHNMSLDLSASFNVWTPYSNSKFDHLSIQPELRYWFQRPMAQHFVGFTLLYLDYDFTFKGTNHFGQGVGAGFTYGYDFVLSKRWNLEVTAGVGGFYRMEREYEKDQPRPDKNNSKGWNIIPIKLGITLSYVIF